MKTNLENLEVKYKDCETFFYSFKKIAGLKLIKEYFDSTVLEKCDDYIRANLKTFVAVKKWTPCFIRTEKLGVTKTQSDSFLCSTYKQNKQICTEYLSVSKTQSCSLLCSSNKQKNEN